MYIITENFGKWLIFLKLGSHCAITCDNFEVPLDKSSIFASKELSRLAIAQCEPGLRISLTNENIYDEEKSVSYIIPIGKCYRYFGMFKIISIGVTVENQ